MSRGVHWIFTLNNYTAVDELHLSSLVEDNVCRYLIYGKEVAETGTPHLQGFVQFYIRKRMTQCRNLISDRAYFELARDVDAAVDYCKKEHDFVEYGILERSCGRRTDLEAFKADVKSGVTDLAVLRETHSSVLAKYHRFALDYVNDNIGTRHTKAHPLYQWQYDLKVLLDAEPDDRHIIFIVDFDGNSGKSWFCHRYAYENEDVQIIPPGKKNDMCYALRLDIRVLFIDAPRSKQGDYIQYDFLEEVKNGYIFSPKYESRTKSLKPCHVVVMMNEDPDMNKLSPDRYQIIRTCELMFPHVINIEDTTPTQSTTNASD